jgi:flagellar FliJ protein
VKKFVFSLARLKKYREQVLETEKNTLSILRRQLSALQERLENLLLLIESKNDELRNLYLQGTTPHNIAVIKRYIAVCQQDAEELRGLIAAKDTEVQRQLGVVIAATQEVSTLEKLEERQLEEYRKAAQHEDELFIEEFVQNADFRKNRE